MGKNTLAPGFRFHPTDVELIMYYLKRKILGKKFSANPIAEIDIYKCAPWDLPEKSCLKTGDLKWYFYCPISKRYGRAGRVNRANVYGYWKATGKDRPVKYNDEVVGMIKSLVFHRGKSPHGERMDWVMHEYRLEEKKLADRGIVQDSYMLYVVFKKDGVGPKNGAQYGAPYKEEDWSDDDDETNFPGTGSLCGTSIVAVASGSCIPKSLCVGTTVDSSGVHTLSLVGDTTHTNDDVNCTTVTEADVDAYTSCTRVDTPEAPMIVGADVVPAPLEAPQLAVVPQDQECNDYNIVSMLEAFTEDDNQMTGNVTNSFIEAANVSEEDDIQSLLAEFTEVYNSNNWCL